MHEWQNLSHVRWDCKYHIVIIPKYRRKVFYGRLRRQVGVILRELCRQRGIELVEGHAMPDHVHLCLSIPPKHSVAHSVGFLKGKSAVRIHRELLHERRLTGLHFWAAGYCVSTVGLDEARVRQYIREQEELAAFSHQGVCEPLRWGIRPHYVPILAQRGFDAPIGHPPARLDLVDPPAYLVLRTPGRVRGEARSRDLVPEVHPRRES
jgi:putative transposase